MVQNHAELDIYDIFLKYASEVQQVNIDFAAYVLNFKKCVERQLFQLDEIKKAAAAKPILSINNEVVVFEKVNSEEESKELIESDAEHFCEIFHISDEEINVNQVINAGVDNGCTKVSSFNENEETSSSQNEVVIVG